MKENKELLDKLVKELTDLYGSYIYSIILYGSVARGTDTSESDIDIAMIVSKDIDKETEDELSAIIVGLNLEYNRVLSVIDINLDTFNKWRGIMPFYKNIEKEGIMLWKAA